MSYQSQKARLENNLLSTLRKSYCKFRFCYCHVSCIVSLDTAITVQFKRPNEKDISRVLIYYI